MMVASSLSLNVILQKTCLYISEQYKKMQKNVIYYNLYEFP